MTATNDSVQRRDYDQGDWLRQPAGLAQFRLKLPGLGPHQINVETFDCSDLGVSSDYSLRLQVSASARLDPGALLGEGALLALEHGEDPALIHGVVTGIEHQGDGPYGYEAVVRMRSPLCVLAASVHHRVFRRRTAREIAVEVLEQGLDGMVPVLAEAGAEPPEQAMVVQHNETDLDFVRRVLARDGLFLTVRQTRHGAEVVIHDHLPAVAARTVSLRYQRPNGQVRGGSDTAHAMRAWSGLEPERVHVSDFEPAKPDRSGPGEATYVGDVPAAGTRAFFGQRGGGQEACEALAGVCLQALDAKRQGAEIETACRQLAPGVTIDLSNHSDAALNGQYVVVSAHHSGDQAAALRGGAGAGRPAYLCVARLLPVEVPYRDEPVQPRPGDGGLLVGQVEGGEDGRANLDNEGAYRVRFALDDGDAEPGRASPPVRMAQPYGGKDYGMHFPLLPKTRVVMAGLNGDGERPVILGALPTASQRPPVTSHNPHQHLLRTPAGHQLCLDDKPASPRLSLSAAYKAGSLVMEAGSEQHRVALTTPDGDIDIASGADMTVRSGGDRHVEVEGEYAVSVVDNHTLHAERGTLSWRAVENLELVTDEGDLLQEATDGAVDVRAGDALHLEAGDGLTIRATGGDAALTAEAGTLDLEVEGDLALVSTGDGAIAIGEGSGLRIDGSGDVILEGEQVRISGNQITLAATDISEN